MSDITVSIFILTYNQEQFIAQTIEGVLMQKTNFKYQLVIGEDCSIDKTRVICESYAKEYGVKIKLLPNLPNNIGLISNYMRTIKECDGKYIAICDGDDYWIDENKLQKQVDFLENNPEYSIVYTAIKLLYSDGNLKNWNPNPRNAGTQFEHLIFDNHIPSVSVLFKNIQNSENELPTWVANFPFGDWPTYLWTIRNGGKIHFLKDITAVYRMDTGISTQIRKVNSNILKINLEILNYIFSDINFIHKKDIVYKAILEKKLNLMSSYNREGKYFKAFRQYIINLKQRGVNYNDAKMYLYSIYKSLV
ncbi:glycosyltransferase [Flavobacterium sp.]|uniref:glycosyltransferase n=1 Tax=Flavobacterium sp. TaxID=239 RepID=UPI003751B46D